EGSPHSGLLSSSRNSLTHALISSRPLWNLANAPLYLSNRLEGERAGRITVFSPSTTNSTRSPADRPRRCRICCGTVTCPLELIELEDFIFTFYTYSKDI